MFSWLFSNPLAEGTPAPDFSLPDDSGGTMTLSQHRGRPVVLVFYPGDDTPGCTKQLCQFRDDWSAVRAKGMEVYGVNPRSSGSHKKFRNKHRLPFPLLVDRGQKVAALYQCNGLFIKRTVYLIDSNGIIRFGRRGMPSPTELLSMAE